MPTLRQYEHAIALAEHRNFSRAADSVGITQSALTQSIHRLEEEFGIVLFERGRGNLRPTHVGIIIMTEARDVLARLSGLERRIGLMNSTTHGRLIIGCELTFAEQLLSKPLKHLIRYYSEIRLSVHVESRSALIADLLSGGIDIYVGTAPVITDRRIEICNIDLPDLTTVCRPNHPLLSKPNLKIGDCFAYPMAGPRAPRWYDEWLNRDGERLSKNRNYGAQSQFFEIDDYSLIRGLVAATDTLSGGLPLIFADDVRRGDLCVLPIPSNEFSFRAVLATLVERPPSRSAQLFIETIKGECAAH